MLTEDLLGDKKISDSFDKFVRHYRHASRGSERSVRRLCKIKWNSMRTPKCPTHSATTLERRERGNRVVTFRCARCPGRREYSFIKDTFLAGKHWKPDQLLIAGFYLANTKKPRAITLGKLADIDRATAGPVVKWHKKNRPRVRLKEVGATKLHDKYVRRGFKVLAKMLAPAQKTTT